MLTLGIRKIEAFVSEQQSLGNNVRWNGYTLEFFRPEPKAIYSKDGAYRDGEWGYLNTTDVDSDGLWHIDFRNVKRVKRAGRKH